MDRMLGTEKCGAVVTSVFAQGYNIVEFLVDGLGQMFAAATREVDADFMHNPNSHWVCCTWSAPGRKG